MRIMDRIAIVTGAGSGIGRAIALRFAAEGATVVAADIDEESVAALARNHDRIISSHLDATDGAAVDALVADTAARFGGLDVMVNNVGSAVHGPLKDTSDSDWDHVIAITLSSAFYGTRAALRVMLPRRSGSIINISSGAGFGGSAGMGSYGAAKAGVNNLTQSAAVENARSGVRVNCISPGAMGTPPVRAWAATLPGGVEAYEASLLPGRFGEPEDIAAAALFLASDEASFVNGVILPVDGAACARMPAIPVIFPDGERS